MNLPDYFLCDVPAALAPEPGTVRQACEALKANRGKFLRDRSTASLVRTLASVGESWLDPHSPFRTMLAQSAPQPADFSPPVLLSGLDPFFRQLAVPALNALIHQDLGHLQRLDDLSANEFDTRENRAAFARGPALIAHVAGGAVPCAVLSGMVLAILARSAQFVKCASGASIVPRLFAHSIYEHDRKLGSTIEIAEWKGGTEQLDDALFSEADCVVAIGSDDTLETIRKKLPLSKRFIGYGHRLSIGYVTLDALSPAQINKSAAAAAEAVAAWDQSGCLSPQVIYVEDGGRISPLQFAEELAQALDLVESALPRRKLPVQTAASIDSRRAFYNIRAAHSLETQVFCSANSTAWTVIYESDPQFQPSCLDRFIYVKPIAHERQLTEVLAPLENKISTLGIAGSEERVREIALAAAKWGIPRVCPLAKMQQPPLLWRHDGRPALADLLTWTDWEML